MKSITRILTGVALVTAMSTADAQTQNAPTVLDGIYVKEHTPERKVVPYTYLREADVMWSKRIWRKIDMREKINHILYYPTEPIQGRESLMQVLKRAVIEDGTLTAYEDEEFRSPRTKQEIMASLSKVDTNYVDDPDNPGQQKQVIVPNEFNPGSVKQFRIKEDWFFDKQKSVLEVRIIGIAPIQEVLAPDGSVKGDKVLFWVYFPEARYIFANAEVYNRQNDAERRTYEDIFWKRMFGSYVYKEQNVYDRRIADYSTGMDALLESERVKEDIFNFEHDLWEY
jgi:gliding motility associated protien GldN